MHFNFIFFFKLTWLPFNIGVLFCLGLARWELRLGFLHCYLGLYFWEVWDLLNNEDLVDTLALGFVGIHPFCFYSFFLFCLFLNQFLSWEFFFSKLRLFILGGLTLSLGMFWGVFSFLWGFFWVSDPIEWVLFLSILYLCFLLHSYNFYFSFFLFALSLFLSLFCLLLVRFSVVWSRHSFFIEVSFKYFNFFIFYFGFLLSLYSTVGFVVLYLGVALTLPYLYSYLLSYFIYLVVSIHQSFFLILLHLSVLVFFLDWSLVNCYYTVESSVALEKISAQLYFFVLEGSVESLGVWEIYFIEKLKLFKLVILDHICCGGILAGQGSAALLYNYLFYYLPFFLISIWKHKVL